MREDVIVVYGHCKHDTAKGDYSFAGSIAKDIKAELSSHPLNKIDVILVSLIDGMARLEQLYGKPINGRVLIHGVSVGISSLEEFDPIEHNVIAFIEANRCKFPPAKIIKQILSPQTKFLFIENANSNLVGDRLKTLYKSAILEEQPDVYDFYHSGDMLIENAGVDENKIGIPNIEILDVPAQLNPEENPSIVSSSNYGIIYMTNTYNTLNVDYNDFKLMAQYIRLTNLSEYYLIGDYATKKTQINKLLQLEAQKANKSQPHITFYSSLPNSKLRHLLATSSTPLVVSTGVLSTLEAMFDKKLVYYQYSFNNNIFVLSYLQAVKSLLTDETKCEQSVIRQFADKLFAPKPLRDQEVLFVEQCLNVPVICEIMLSINKIIIEQANGKLAKNILGLVSSNRRTQDSRQLKAVRSSLRKNEEEEIPGLERSLRRAAASGKLLELKVIAQALSKADLNQSDPSIERTALHWSVINHHLDCVRLLISLGAKLDLQDKYGMTALHYAISNSDRAMVRVLLDAGASPKIIDNKNRKPQECSPPHFFHFVKSYVDRTHNHDNSNSCLSPKI